MYPGPASGVTPTFGPCPPSGQLNGATTGEPLIPSPTSGSRPALIRPIFAGQPGRIAAEGRAAALRAPPEPGRRRLAARGCSEHPPPAFIAYTRPLANSSRLPSPRSDAVLVLELFSDPSPPLPVKIVRPHACPPVPR